MSSARLRNSLLTARDRRQTIMEQQLQACSPTTLMLSLNLPGPDKNPPGAEALFLGMLESLAADFPDRVILVRESDPLGHWALIGLDRNAADVKRHCMALEEALPAGRLVDLDVFDRLGKQISRSALGLSQRTCLVCQQPAVDCIRLARHSAAALSEKRDELLAHFRD